MAVDERSSPQTGDQLRFENTNNTTATDSSSASEGAAASRQSEVCKDVVTADEHEEDGTTLISGPRTGRGRRKQCRPVRVCLRDDDDGGGGGNNDDVAVNAKAPEVSSLPEAVGLPAQNVCELCGAEETSPEALAAHASTCRGRSYPDADDAAASGRAFPTPYHQLGSELMRGADAALLDAGSDRPPTSTDSATPVDCSLSYTDDHAVTARYHGRTDDLDDESDVPLDFTLHSEQLASSSSSSSSALSSSAGIDVCSGAFSVAATMKHLPEVTSSAAMSVGADAEDFCEFCQKRFCNKYYLRKHRHDVHGVPASDTHPLPQQQQVSNSFLPQDALPLLALTSDALTAHDDFITSSSSLSTSAQQLPFQTPLMTSLQPFVLPFQTSTSTTNSLLFQSPPSAADLATSPADAAGLLPSLTSLMLLNPFASSLALLNSSSFLHQTSPAAAAAAAAYSASSSLNTLAELQKTNAAAAAAVGSGGFGGLCDDVAALSALMNPFLPPPPSDPSSGMTVDDPLSSSHHCELCRKEFCSAYFLAVHRREKHGIATSTALSDTIRLLAAGNGRPGGVLESLGAGTEPGEKLPSGGAAGRAGKSHGERTSTLAETSCSSTASEQVSAADQVCGLCKKQFPNRYGLVLHLLSAHNVRPEGFGLAGELLQLDGVGGRPQSAAAASGKGGLGSGLTLGASAASSSGSSTGSSSKQSDRVSCDICNKEVCNKYFLKTHKMKVHGLDAVAAAIYNPPPPPLDSTRSEAARSPASVSSSSRQHQQQQQQHDEMRKALLMADSQFSAFASHLDFALKSAASTDPTGAAGFGVLPPPLQQQQQTGEPMMTASDIFRLFGLVGSKQDDPFLSLGPPPPPLSLHSLLSGIDLCSPLTDAAKHTKPVELKIPKHVSHHHKDTVNVGMQQHQQPGRVKHSAGHHNGRHGRDQAGAPPPPPQVGAPRQSQPAATAVGPPSDQELIQSGIDPEAYCELCQKEFCSKYFLRTHRQKIHGVSASKTAAVDVSFDHYRPMTHQAAGANPVLQMFPGLALPTQPMFGSGPTGLLPPAPVVDVSSDPFVVSPQGRAGAKEAANATRVTCDVCGKELCNKYFLRTHMAKIHGCTTGNGSFEPDVGEATSDTSENRVAPDDRAARGSPSYEKWPTASGSLPNSADHWNIPPLPSDSIPPPPHRPHSRNYSQETDFPPRDNGEDTASRANASLDPPHSTQVAFAGDEAVEHLIENGERSLPVTRNDRPSKMDEESSSSNLDTEPRSDVAALFDPDISQVRAEKRAVTANDDDDDDDGITKRPRTDCMSDSSTLTGDEVTGNHAADHPETDDHSRSYDSTASSGVIQFVSRSKDSVYHSAENSNEPTEKMQVENCSPGTSTDAGREHPQSANAAKQPVLRSSTGRGDYDGPWFTTVNGHADLPRETAGWQAAVSDGEHHHQQQQPLMQPFIMRQEPLHAPASCDGAGSPGTSSSAAAGDRSETTTTTQFAACQLMLPVIRPIRDQLTVEFSVTPVVSSD